ncbi:hypothetical protein TNCT_377911 [Trichonephila clavata]|uniref:Uncharacterized protein n=1 Tax=Trichonephila clavata TaxID=2740835 RepID=A0A8X6I636_TRICU|nr:hypothetical protein TNCT_377911 [Trichonephila clavata]
MRNSTESAKRSSGNRPKKRKFTGNMYTRDKAVHSVHESLNNSASGKKIQLQDVDSSFIENNDGFDGYRVFDKNIMFTNIQNFASCKKCGGDITLTEQCVRERHFFLLRARYFQNSFLEVDKIFTGDSDHICTQNDEPV